MNDKKISDEEGKRDKTYTPWEIARELGQFSFEQEIRRYQEIIDSFKQISATITLVVTVIITIGIEALKEFLRIANNGMLIIAFVLFLLLSVIMMLSLWGQYYDKLDYIKTAGELQDFFEEHESEYEGESEAEAQDSKNFVFINQITKAQRTRREVCHKKAKLLRICQGLVMCFVTVCIVTIVYFILFTL